MAKIQHRYTGQVQRSQQGLQGVNVQYSPNDFGAQIGQGLASFGAALDKLEERKKASGRFDQLSAYTDFETQVKLDLENMKRDTKLNEADYFTNAERAFETSRSAFLDRVPPEYQPEFEARSNTLKQSVIFDAYEFGNNQRDAFFTKKIGESTEAGKLKLSENPKLLEQIREENIQLIMSTDKSEIDKEQDLAALNRSLEAVAFKERARTAKTASLAAPPAGLHASNLPPAAGGILAAIAKRESGGRYDVRYGGADGPKTIHSFSDHPRQRSVISEGGHKGKYSSASGKYQFISSTWDAAAAGAGVTDFSPESQDRAAWYWAQKTVQEQTGKPIATLIQEGNIGAIKNALGTQWEGVRTMSIKEFTEELTNNTGVFADYSALNADPSFRNLPLEARQTLIRDAELEANAEFNALLKQQEEADQKSINDLMVGLFDGNKGLADINALRNEGVLVDYADINRAHSIIEGKEKDLEDFRTAATMYENGSVWDRKNNDHVKYANLLFGAEGAAAINSMSDDYITGTAIPRFQRMGMMPPDMANLIYAATQGQDLTRATYGYESLSRLRAVNPVAFENQMPDQVVSELDAWEQVGQYATAEDTIKQVQNRGATVADRQELKLFEDDARERLKEIDVVGTVLSHFNEGFFGIGGRSVEAEQLTPGQSSALSRDYETLYVQEMKRYRNADKAEAAALKGMGKIWGLSDIGGVDQFIRYPPDKVGYKPIGDSYDWIGKQVFKAIGQPSPQWFEFVPDEQTAQEARDFKAGVPNAPAPSYRIRYMGANGLIRVLTTQNGTEARMNFERPKGADQAVEDAFIEARDRAQRSKAEQREAQQSLQFAPMLDIINPQQTGPEPAIRNLGGDMGKLFQ